MAHKRTSRQNRPIGAGVPVRRDVGRTLTSLQEFLEVLKANKIDPTMVDPTKLLTSSLFTGPGAYLISPQLWGQIQGFMSSQQQLAQQQASGAPEPPAGGGGGAGGVSTVQTGTDVIPSPILEVMAEQRARREASRQASQNRLSGMLTAIPQFAPKGATTYPGMEHGGLADIMMGIISGKGVEGARSLIPQTTREPGIQEIPASLFEAIGAAEPSMGSEFDAASSIASMILGQMLRIPRFSAVSSGGGSAAAAEPSAEDAGLNAILAALGGS